MQKPLTLSLCVALFGLCASCTQVHYPPRASQDALAATTWPQLDRSNDAGQGAELAGERLTGLVPGHRDDLLGAHHVRRDHAAETDRAAADDHGRAALTYAGSDGRVPAGGHHVGQGQQRRDQGGIGHAVGLHQAALGLGDQGVLRLAAEREATVLAG